LFRNFLRTALTGAAIMLLVFIITLIWTVLCFLDLVTADKSKDLKAIVTEKFQVPSQMPYAYVSSLSGEVRELPERLRPGDDGLMGWTFYGGTTDKEKMTRENLLFFFALEPSRLRSMMDDLQNLDPELVRQMESKRDACILGLDRMKTLNKRVGERISVTSI